MAQLLYRYLDRQVGDLAETEIFLLSAMRAWVPAARSGRSVCRALRHGFVTRCVAGALQDFHALMMVIDQQGLGHLRFASVASSRVTDDEARLLALFACARNGESTALGTMAAGLVGPATVRRLTSRAEAVSVALAARCA